MQIFGDRFHMIRYRSISAGLLASALASVLQVHLYWCICRSTLPGGATAGRGSLS